MLFTPRQRWTVGGVGVILVLFVFLLQHVRQPFSTTSFSISSFGGKMILSTTIPNVVHFVHLVRGSDSEPVLEISFRQFIAIYSSHYYLNPKTIYIHTNIEEHLLEAALNASSTPYSRVLMRMPNLVFNQESPPLKTSKGKEVSELAHRSDLMRTRVLKRWGGLYLDEDSYVVRDLQPLRDSGFAAVVGKDPDDKVSNAVVMTAPKGNLITAFEALQEKTFDGRGTAHSIDLLTRLAQDFSGIHNQALVLATNTFHPISCNNEGDILDFYLENSVYPSEGPIAEEPIINCEDCEDIKEYLDHAADGDERQSRVDWQGSYVLHGCNSPLSEMEVEQNVFANAGNITLNHVMERRSRFANVVYPAVMNAVETGLLEGTADELADHWR